MERERYDLQCGVVRSISALTRVAQEVQTLEAGDAVSFPITAAIMLGALYSAFKFFAPVYINALVNGYLAIGAAGAGAVLLHAPVQALMCGGRPMKQYELPILGSVTWAHLPGAIVALVAAVAWAVCGHWSANNALATLLCIAALQQISVGRVRTAFLLLCLLFVYDIVMVFYTPLMVTVAKNINAPIKLMFPASPSSMAGVAWEDGLEAMQNASAPLMAGEWSAILRPSAVDGNGSFAADASPTPSADRSAMLGLGDIVLPGIFVAMMLRFDAARANAWSPEGSTAPSPGQDLALPDPVDLSFSKPYFIAQMVAYVGSLLATLIAMYVYKHAQPALLYLVPGALLAAIVTALWRGEWNVMMAYSEGGSQEDLVSELYDVWSQALAALGMGPKDDKKQQ